jgi:hypothetical protein
MKMHKTCTALTLALGAAVTAQAATTTTTQIAPTTTDAVYISGSTAFRGQVYQGLKDLGLTPQADDASGNNQFTFTGQPNANVIGPASQFPLPAGLVAAGTTVTVYCSFDGSAQGVANCTTPSRLNFFENVGGFGGGGVYANGAFFAHASDIAFSDVQQASTVSTAPTLREIISADAETTANPPGPGTGIAVQPFLWGGNAAAKAAGIANINRNDIDILLNTGNVPLAMFDGVPTHDGGTAATEVVLTGRDNSSGTRITAELLEGWNPVTQIDQWEINSSTSDPATLAAGFQFADIGVSGADSPLGSGGYSSGGKVADALEYPGTSNPAIGYLSWNDAKTLPIATANTTGWTTSPADGTILSYQGVNPVSSLGAQFPVYNINLVINGQWPFWAYEHLYEGVNVTSGGYVDADFGPGLVEAVGYEISIQVAATPQTAVLIGAMNVNRGTTDGTPLNPFYP